MATPLFTRVILNEKELAERVEKVAAALAPDIVRIRYNLGKDWIGEDAVYFRILMADKAVKREGLWELTRRAVKRLREEIALDEIGLLSYHSFRTVSEQKAMKDEDWN